MSARRYLFAVSAATVLPLLSVAHAQETMPPLPPPAPSTPSTPSTPDAGAEPVYVLGSGGSAAPPAAPPASAAEPQKPKDEDGDKERTSFRGTGGFQYAKVHGVPITGARVRLGFGMQKDSSANYGTVSMLYGGTESGLRTWDFRVGYVGDFFRWRIIRLGLSAEVGYLFIRRATLDERMWALGAGGGVHAGFDLFPFGPHNDHAVTAEARFDVHLHFGAAVLWGPTISLGFRY